MCFFGGLKRYISYLQHECGQRIKLLTHNIMSLSGIKQNDTKTVGQIQCIETLGLQNIYEKTNQTVC